MADKPASARPSPPAPSERRRHARAITNFSADLQAGGGRYAARVINLSVGGALLGFEGFPPAATIAVGDAVRVDIRCRATSQPVTVDGKAVLWNLLSGKEPLLAVQFDEVSDEAGEILEELMAEAVAELGCRAARKRAPGR